MTPSLGSLTTPVKVWVTGVWTSELCDLSLQSFPSSGDNKWGVLRWFEEGTDDESKAKVRVDILNSDGVVVRSDLSGDVVINNSRFNRSVNLGLLSDVNTIDVKVRFKLQSLSEQPIVSGVELNAANAW